MSGYLFIQYIILVFLVILSANKASKMVDDIDNKTNIGGALLGGVFLAGITSLPELISTLSSSTIIGEPGLAFGNIFGSNIFNLVIIALADLFFIKKLFFNDKKSKENQKNNKIVMILYIAILTPLLLDVFILEEYQIFGISSGTPISLISIFILVVYSLNIKRLISDGGDTEKSSYSSKKVSESVKKEVVTLILWSIILVFSSLLITSVTNDIAEALNLNASFAGALFLGIATSLPELTAVYTLIRRNNTDAAISNIVGSNIFNLVILSFVDLITFKNIYGSIANDTDIQINVTTLLILGLINTIILMYAFVRKKTFNKFFYIIPSIWILLNYIGYLLLSTDIIKL